MNVTGVVLCGVLLIPLLAPAEAELPLLREMHKRYLRLPRESRVACFADAVFRSNLVYAGWHPQPVELPFRLACAGRTVSVTEKTSGKEIYRGRADGACLEVWNLEIGRSYVWQAWDAGGKQAGQGAFRTEDCAPRLLKVPGVLNFRDLGGRTGLNGRRVRQGRVFRSAGLNDNAHDEFFTADETRRRLGHQAYDRIVADGEKDLLFWREACEGKRDVRLVGGTIPRDWCVIVNGKGEMRRHDGEGRLKISDGVRGLSDAEARIEFDVVATEAGWFPVDVGADWYYSLSVNGEKVVDRMTDGSGFDPFASCNRQLPLPVRAGANRIVAVVRPGDLSWVFRLKAAATQDVRELSKGALAERELMLRRRTSEVFRCCVAGSSRLDAAACFYMTNALGIRTDIDLRGPHETFGMTGSPLGSNVRWRHISSAAYGNMVTAFGREAFAKAFAVFLDDGNYPIDFHCIAGQDRTGSLAFILNALLGVDEDELYKDWEATGFWNPKCSFRHEGSLDALVAVFRPYPGETLRERVENYVKSVGFTDADIASFRKLMLED